MVKYFFIGEKQSHPRRCWMGTSLGSPQSCHRIGGHQPRIWFTSSEWWLRGGCVSNLENFEGLLCSSNLVQCLWLPRGSGTGNSSPRRKWGLSIGSRQSSPSSV